VINIQLKKFDEALRPDIKSQFIYMHA